MKYFGDKSACPRGLSISIFTLFLFFAFYGAVSCSKSANEKRVCRLVDSEVDGMEFIVNGVRGLTKKGEFEYHMGDRVSFYVGGIKIGETVPCKDILSVVDLGPQDNRSPENQTVVNISRFLQSIDDDGVPDNGIAITPGLREKIQALGVSAIDFTQTDDRFSQDATILAIMRILTEVTASWRPFTRYAEGSYVNPSKHVLNENNGNDLYVFKAVKPPGTNPSGEYEPLFHLSTPEEIERWIKDTYAIETLPVKEGDKGYKAYAYYKDTIITDNGETYWRDSEIYWLKSRRDLVSKEKALAHLRKTLAANNLSSVLFINLGDGLTAGAQNNESLIHEGAQIHSWPAMVASKLEASSSLIWNNPLICYDILNRSGMTASGYALVNEQEIPTNLAVDGATIESLIYQSYESFFMAAVYAPLNEIFRAEGAGEGDDPSLTQLQAAISLASAYPGREKIITLWIGMNDIYGAIRKGRGGNLSSAALNIDKLSDPDFVAGLKENLNLLLSSLEAISNSHLFIANIPGVSSIGLLLDQTDLQSIYAKSTGKSDMTPFSSMRENLYLGLTPFIEKIFPHLGDGDETISTLIDASLANDDASLTTVETEALTGVIDEINTVMKDYTDTHDRATLVDLHEVFSQAAISEINLDATEKKGTIAITSSIDGGLYALDGYTFSDTGYALIAKAFIDAINQAGVGVSLDEIDAEKVAEIWQADPYKDWDQDGFPQGPAKDNLIDPFYFQLLDCDDFVREIPGAIFTGENECP